MIMMEVLRMVVVENEFTTEKNLFWLSGGGSALKTDYSLQFQDHGDLGRSSRAVRKVKRS